MKKLWKFLNMDSTIYKGRPKIKEETGVALIFSYLVLSVLVVMTAGFGFSTSTELGYARRYKDATIAFWRAEAGASQFLKDTTLLNGGDICGQLTEGASWNAGLCGAAYDVVITKDDSDPDLRIVTATATVNGISRQVHMEFPGNPPKVFDNTMSTGANLNLAGFLAKLEVFGKTRITGAYNKTGFGAVGTFEDKLTGITADETTFTYPDSDVSGTANEFNDFVEFNRDIVSSYEPSEVLYIQSDSTQVIIPNGALVGKKVIYVEGTTPGSGDVNILFDASWQSGQNVTVISTGSVNYIQPLQFSADSQLNIISWSSYEEASILYSTHDGVTYTHGTANFYSIFAYSETEGSVIANGNINANEALAWKRFNYGDPLVDETLPPGFEGLVSSSPAGYSAVPNLWKEI